MRALKVIAGVVCIALVFWPASLAFVMFRSVVIPRLTSPTNANLTQTVIFNGRKLAPWEIYAIPIFAAIAALGLLRAGLWLIWPRSHDEN
jgi:hypothetical protein